MPAKSNMKKNGAARLGCHPQEKSQAASAKNQPLPAFSHTHGEDLGPINRTHYHPVDTESDINAVMDTLVDISSYLLPNEHILEQTRADKATEET